MILFELMHSRIVVKEKGYSSSMWIDLYSTLEKANAVKDRYGKELEGFKDYPDCFFIEEIDIPDLTDSSENVYEVSFEIQTKEEYDEEGIIGYYAKLSQAEQAKAKLMKSRSDLNTDMITIGKVWIDRSFWVDGFFTYISDK